jgi:voltage-gated potassium channel
VVGKLLGGLVSIIGIGTLALFSGVITVGFLDQLRIRREQAALVMRITVSERSLNGKGAQGRANEGDCVGLADLKMTSTFTEQTSSNQMCPHCRQILVPSGHGHHAESDGGV